MDGLGNVSLTEYDRYGNLLTSTDALGNVTTYTRDGYGDPIVVDTPDGARVSVSYAACRLPARIENPDGSVWQHVYDRRGNLLTTTDPVGATITYDYDQRGHLTRATDALGGSWSFESNDAGRPTAMTNPAGAVTRYGYDGFGRVITMTAANGGVHRFGWTPQGKLAWELDPTGARREMAYDAQGNLVSSQNEAGGITTFEVGPFDRLAARTDPDGARYTFDYDVPLRLTGVRNPAGARWSYEYDPAGNLVAETDFTGRTVTYQFDAAGRQLGRFDAAGTAIVVERDPVGRIITQRAGDSVTEFRYDAAGRLVRADGDGVRLDYARDPLGRVIAETVDGLTVTSTYDVLGRRTHRNTPHGVASAWGYTAAGWESSLVGTGGGLTFEYDGSGRETSRLLGAGAVLTQAFDQLGRLAEQHVWRYPEAEGGESGEPGGSVQFRAYLYRQDGPVREIHDRLRGDLGYELTPGGRVTGVRAETWQERYRYDLSGNLTETAPGAERDEAGLVAFDGCLPRAAGRARFDYDPQGRLVRVIRHTLSGRRRVWTYTWNALNRLVGVTTPDSTWRYVYDPLGRRIAKRRIGPDGALVDETRFVWDGTELIEQRRTDTTDGPAVVTVTTWDYRSGNHRPLAQTTRSWLADAPQLVIDTRFHAIVTDLVGTATELVTPDGRIAWRRTASLWGLTLGVSASDRTDCPLRFPGQYHDDETGLHYNYFRYYDPATGRYLTPDPLGLAPAPNQYGYVRNPVVAGDPLGLAGYRDPVTGRFTHDPSAPPILHNRDTEYPGGYRQTTHDEMARNWTDEGVAQGQAPVDANGVRIPRDQLHWFDGDGNPVPADQLTYEHLDPVVEHWNSTGYNTGRAARNDWYNDPNNMEPMTRGQNSSGGGQMTSRYRQDVGPNYSCT